MDKSLGGQTYHSENAKSHPSIKVFCLDLPAAVLTSVIWAHFLDTLQQSVYNVAILK